MDIAFLLIRLVLGLAIAAHGAQKLFGWFGGYGIAGTAGFMEQLGFKPGKLFAVAAGAGETAGGLLTVLGLGGALGPAIVVMVMIVAVASVHLEKGYFQANGGWELNSFYVISAMSVAFAGSGAYSLDRVLDLSVLTDANQVWIAMGAAVVLAVLNLLARRREEQAAATP